MGNPGCRPRPGLVAAGALMLGAGFLPCLKIMGESASLYRLARNGFSPPWCWVLLSSGLFAWAAALALPRRKAASALALTAFLIPSLFALFFRLRGGGAVWRLLGSGSWLLLTGAVGCGVLSVTLLTEDKHPG